MHIAYVCILLWCHMRWKFLLKVFLHLSYSGLVFHMEPLVDREQDILDEGTAAVTTLIGLLHCVVVLLLLQG